MKQKTKWSLILLAITFLLSGCGKQQMPIEDYVQSNPSTRGINGIMKSDMGYYYSTTSTSDTSNAKMSLHYFDEASGQNIYLCSKPECRHDGDAFCTATSDEYTIKGACFYGGSLYLSTLEATGTEYLLKLLRVSTDGSERTEVITYMKLNTTSVFTLVGGEQMMIHRGVVVLPYYFVNKEEMQTTNNIVSIMGTCLYNLETGELTQLPELRSEEFLGGRERFTGYGDYIYYNTKVDNKNVLSRYCLSDGTTEELELMVGFNGIYEVIDEDTIYYTQAGNTLFEYQISNKGTIRHDGFFLDTYEYYLPPINANVTGSKAYTCTDMVTDGTYLYAGDGVDFHEMKKGNIGTAVYSYGVEEEIKSYIHVFDRDLTEVAKVEIGTKPYLGCEENFSVAIFDGMVYLQTTPTVFSCTLEEFLKGGQPPFEPVYHHQDVEYLKYQQ